MVIDIDPINEPEDIDALLNADEEYQVWLNEKLSQNIEFMEENDIVLE